MRDCLPIVSALFENVRRVIVGKDEQIRQLICCWIAGGHLLIEDAPGTGKTILARAISKSGKVPFRRIQFTPDLLPTDIVGSAIFNQQKASFEFMRGPIFSTLVLADEINRATPRTQSALLEAMAEGQVTAEGMTWPLPALFFVIATQNPIEQHGTFPLPEAQLDRFMMKISMGYPRPDEEIGMLKGQNETHPIQTLKAVETEERIKYVRDSVHQVRVTDPVYQYAVDLVGATRKSKELKLGASPRATIALLRASQAMALMEGKDYVEPSHLHRLSRYVLAHRLVPTAEARLAGKTSDQILEGLVKDLRVPVS
jgi:MoxR-like ATPase